MNKFMEKQGNKLPLVAAIALLVAFISNFLTTVLCVVSNSLRYGYSLRGIFTARIITNDVLFGLAILLFAVGAIIYWRKKTGAFMATAGGVVGILQLFVYFIFTVIIAIRWGNFNTVIRSGVLVNGLLLISYLFLIVAGFLKPKKPTLAYIFGGIVAALILIGVVTDGFATIQSMVYALGEIFDGRRFQRVLPYLVSFFWDLFDGCGNLLFYIGLLALNFTIIWNKVVPAEEVPAIEEAAEEAPVEEATEVAAEVTE